MVKVMYNDKLAYKVVIWVFLGVMLWKEKDTLSMFNGQAGRSIIHCQSVQVIQCRAVWIAHYSTVHVIHYRDVFVTKWHSNKGHSLHHSTCYQLQKCAGGISQRCEGHLLMYTISHSLTMVSTTCPCCHLTT